MPAFILGFNKFCKDRDTPNPLDIKITDPEDVGGDERKIISSETKSLFREVIKELHPDKSKKIEKEKVWSNSDNYIQAVKAKSENNLQELISISKKVGNGPDIGSLTMEKIKLLTDNLNQANTEIDKIHKSYVWTWFTSSSYEEKNVIFLNFLNSFSK
jgi:hypothetical protein